MGEAHGAQVTMSLRETEGRAAGSQNISTHRGLVTLLVTQHPMVSGAGPEGDTGAAPGTCVTTLTPTLGRLAWPSWDNVMMTSYVMT